MAKPENNPLLQSTSQMDQLLRISSNEYSTTPTPIFTTFRLHVSWLSAIALILAVAASHSPITDALLVHSRPSLYGDRLPPRLISTRNRRVQHRIVMLHNFFRTQVRPPAANMLHMRWHAGAAKNAQRWADQCQFLQHDAAEARAVCRFDQCGQNIFVSSQKVPWLFVLRSWFMEHQNFTFGSPRNEPFVIGHYTQMVWATTHRVGCAVSKCARGGPRGKPFYNYVCDYCPTGNFPQTLATPYKPGAPCSACRSTCKSNKFRLCTNSCPVADNYNNCRELYARSSDWLCGAQNRGSRSGVSIFSGGSHRDQCLASCTCQGKIFQ